MPFSERGPLVPRMSDDDIVASAWESFVRNAAVSGPGLRSVVLDSWQRSRAGAVDPGRHSAPGADMERVRRLLWQNRELCEVARPVLEGLREVLRECGSLIMLSDPAGTILDLNGGTRARSVGEEINLATGGCWSEALIGTNAIGTAIATRAPVQIYANEHFCVDVKRWTCAAAPILDRSGRVRGVVDVSGVKETFHGHTLGLVMAAARQIEADFAHRDEVLNSRLLVAAITDFSRYSSDCLLLVDHRGRILRVAGDLGAVRTRLHLPDRLDVGSVLAALELPQDGESRALHLPGWVQPEWLRPIKDGPLRLGTLIVIPTVAGRTSPARASSATSPADLGTDAFADIIGNSEVLQIAKNRARRIAPLDLPVLLLGETGAGKELFARALHRAGNRPEGPFVAVNCGALTRELLASELFGYAEGAFTGARRGGHPGKFEQAHGGTLFLDEIGEMPIDMQPYLLRAIQDGVIVRVGDTRERRVSVRLVAATNRDLPDAIAAGRFREDLYHRLGVVTLNLPALRDRPGDIDSIVDHLNRRLADKYGGTPKVLTPAVRAALQAYRWPGNIRELQNVIEVMFALCEGDTIDVPLLPQTLTRSEATRPLAARPAAVTAPVPAGRLDDVQRQAIQAAVANARGNLSLAARTLGISRSTLYVKLASMRPADETSVR